MLENKKLDGVHYSRYIASWKNEGGDISYGDCGFSRWLRSHGATDREVTEITEMALMGRMELEFDCMKFIKQDEEEIRKIMNG